MMCLNHIRCGSHTLCGPLHSRPSPWGPLHELHPVGLPHSSPDCPDCPDRPTPAPGCLLPS